VRKTEVGQPIGGTVEQRIAWCVQSIVRLAHASYENDGLPDDTAGDIGITPGGMITAETVQAAIDQIAAYLGVLWLNQRSRQQIINIISEEAGGSLAALGALVAALAVEVITINGDLRPLKHAAFGGI
jgi:hypothetical protein